MANNPAFPIGTLVLALALAVLMGITYVLVKPRTPPAELEGVLHSSFKPLAPFQLQTHDRGPLTRASLEGKWSFVFFGYTSCPDLCPNTLHELNRLQALAADESAQLARQTQVIFVSVDPERDSTEKLASYVAHFHRDFIGATAGRGSIDRLLRQFGGAYQIEAGAIPGHYEVAHSSAIFLVDPYARLIAAFSQPHYAATILAQYRKIVDYYASTG